MESAWKRAGQHVTLESFPRDPVVLGGCAQRQPVSVALGQSVAEPVSHHVAEPVGQPVVDCVGYRIDDCLGYLISLGGGRQLERRGGSCPDDR